MAKATHAQEVSTGTSDSYTEHELTDPAGWPRRAMLGELKEGDLSSQPTVDGGGSIQFSESDQTSNEKPTQPLPLAAQTTENPSGQKVEEPVRDYSAPLTAGDGQRTLPQSSGRKATPVKKATPA